MARKTWRRPYDVTSAIIEFEAGGVNDGERTVELFQHLIDTGMAWTLQGFYGRTAAALIAAGLCRKRLTVPAARGRVSGR